MYFLESEDGVVMTPDGETVYDPNRKPQPEFNFASEDDKPFGEEPAKLTQEEFDKDFFAWRDSNIKTGWMNPSSWSMNYLYNKCEGYIQKAKENGLDAGWVYGFQEDVLDAYIHLKAVGR